MSLIVTSSSRYMLIISAVEVVDKQGKENINIWAAHTMESLKKKSRVKLVQVKQRFGNARSSEVEASTLE